MFKVLGFIDVLLKNKKTGKYRLIDIKTSTRRLEIRKERSNEERDQLLFYKKFIAEKHGCDISDIDVEFFIVKTIVMGKVRFSSEVHSKV